MTATTYTVYDPNLRLIGEYLPPSRVMFTMTGVRIDGRDYRIDRSEHYMGYEMVLWVRP